MELRGLIVGLGNPGERYHSTRHNFGFMVVDQLLEQCRREAAQDCSELQLRKAKGELHRVRLPGAPGHWLVLKPLTYMNESGQSVGYVAGFYKLPPDRILTLHDELDLPLGRMKLKKGGGNAGHNGLKSMAAHLGSNDFHRLRLGIGKPVRLDTRSYVLQRFDKDEEPLVAQTMQAALQGITLFATQGFLAAQQMVNGFVPEEGTGSA